MATLAPNTESWCMNGYDEFGNVEIDGALLMSLLDDTQGVVEDYDDERLRGVIQSLEAEIGMDGGDLFEVDQQQRGCHVKNSQPSDAGQLDGQDISEVNGLDLNIMDMVEMEMVQMEPSFPTHNDGVNYWYMDGVDEYCNRVHFEDFSDYGSLWQETNASSSLRQG